jgi:CheY-like chemotaxis protein
MPARIVVIEDNPADIALLRYALDHHGQDYQLETLLDGEAAIQFVHEQRNVPDPVPCVIVLDWHLPKHNGGEVLKAIRQEPILRHVNIVALTTVSPEDEKEIRRLGVRLYEPKPMELDGWRTLAQRILEVCREGIVKKHWSDPVSV